MSGGGKALVMDDEEMIREVAGDLLTLSGYEVEFAVNGEKAIEAYKNAKDAQRPFDLVILDLTVPGGIGGREAIGALLQIDPGVKAIVSSGHSNDPVVSDYRRFGFQGAILKPYNVTSFVAEVRRVMGAP